MLTLFASCGKQPEILTGVQVETQHIDNDLWLSFSADINLGAMSLPAVTLPVIHPRTLNEVGSVELAPSLGGKNFIKLGVNISELSDVRSAVARLPNGNAVPLIANNPTIVVPLGAGAQLYLTVAENVAAIGVAIPIAQFDTIGQNVGGVNFFPVIAIDRAIATVGLFTSRNPGQNGIALVADLSQYLQDQDVFVPHSSGTILKSMQAQEVQEAQVRLDYSSQTPSKAAQEKINKMVYEMNKKKLKLRLNR